MPRSAKGRPARWPRTGGAATAASRADTPDAKSPHAMILKAPKTRSIHRSGENTISVSPGSQACSEKTVAVPPYRAQMNWLQVDAEDDDVGSSATVLEAEMARF